MVRVFVEHTHHDPGARHLTGLKFQIEFDHASTAQVSVLQMQPVSFQEPLLAFQAALQCLGQAMLEAAQTPGAITQSLRPQRKPLGDQV
jgi:hypothetical protein